MMESGVAVAQFSGSGMFKCSAQSVALVSIWSRFII